MTRTARIYGRALYELAREEGLGEELLEELRSVCSLFDEEPRYMRLLSLPSVAKEERCRLLNESFGGRVHRYILSFMKILVENGTIQELRSCEKDYRSRYYEDNNILPVLAVTAVPLTKPQRKRLTEKLESVTGKSVLLSERTDGSVLGGVRLEMDGRSYDGTVRARLQEIQRRLSGTVL